MFVKKEQTIGTDLLVEATSFTWHHRRRSTKQDARYTKLYSLDSVEEFRGFHSTEHISGFSGIYSSKAPTIISVEILKNHTVSNWTDRL